MYLVIQSMGASFFTMGERIRNAHKNILICRSGGHKLTRHVRICLIREGFEEIVVSFDSLRKHFNFSFVKICIEDCFSNYHEYIRKTYMQRGCYVNTCVVQI